MSKPKNRVLYLTKFEPARKLFITKRTGLTVSKLTDDANLVNLINVCNLKNFKEFQAKRAALDSGLIITHVIDLRFDDDLREFSNSIVFYAIQNEDSASKNLAAPSYPIEPVEKPKEQQKAPEPDPEPDPEPSLFTDTLDTTPLHTPEPPKANQLEQFGESFFETSIIDPSPSKKRGVESENSIPEEEDISQASKAHKPAPENVSAVTSPEKINVSHYDDPTEESSNDKMESLCAVSEQLLQPQVILTPLTPLPLSTVSSHNTKTELKPVPELQVQLQRMSFTNHAMLSQSGILIFLVRSSSKSSLNENIEEPHFALQNSQILIRIRRVLVNEKDQTETFKFLHFPSKIVPDPVYYYLPPKYNSFDGTTAILYGSEFPIQKDEIKDSEYKDSNAFIFYTQQLYQRCQEHFSFGGNDNEFCDVEYQKLQIWLQKFKYFSIYSKENQSSKYTAAYVKNFKFCNNQIYLHANI